jgi:DNA polymerase-3 subunit epsilon
MRPPAPVNFFNRFNSALHGITSAMVADQPSFSRRLDQLLELAGGVPLVAHNSSFDVGAIRQGCDLEDRPWPRLDYACSLVIARRALDLISYRLPSVAEECSVKLEAHHDAGSDALACAQVVLEIARRRGAASLKELLAGLHVLMGRLDPQMWAGCSGKPPPSSCLPPPEAMADADPRHPLYGQVIVCTGALSIRRQDAWAAVAACGATPEKGVTKRTTMLVVGDGFTGDNPADFHTGKAAKAVLWRSKGHRIEVPTEADLSDPLAETQVSGTCQWTPA